VNSSIQKIAGRDYQIGAIRAVLESVEKKENADFF
jgi:type I site-specific restriction endonuclease